MNKKVLTDLCVNAMIAAIYVALLYAFQSFASGEVQFRIAELLMILCLFNPKYAIGVFVGCLIGNAMANLNMLDVILGSLVTLVSGYLMFLLRKTPYIAVFIPVILNAFIIAAIIVYGYADGTKSIEAYFAAAGSVGLGQFVVIVCGGLPLYYLLKSNHYINNLLTYKEI